MYSVIEIGNTTGKIIQFDNPTSIYNSIKFPVAQFSTFIDANFSHIKQEIVLAGSGSPVIISEVLQLLTEMELSVTLVDKQTRLPFVSRYATGQAGVDRLANVATVVDLNLAPCIIVDAGSAITIDLVSCQNEFLGGSILPGIQMQARSLNTGTATLPFVLTSPEEKSGIPVSTVEAIQSGIIQGTIGAIKHLVECGRLRLELKTPVIFTGGDGKWLCRHSQLDYSNFDEHLTAKGLYALALYQQAERKQSR